MKKLKLTELQKHQLKTSLREADDVEFMTHQ